MILVSNDFHTSLKYLSFMRKYEVLLSSLYYSILLLSVSIVKLIDLFKNLTKKHFGRAGFLNHAVIGIVVGRVLEIQFANKLVLGLSLRLFDPTDVEKRQLNELVSSRAELGVKFKHH